MHENSVLSACFQLFKNIPDIGLRFGIKGTERAAIDIFARFTVGLRVPVPSASAAAEIKYPASGAFKVIVYRRLDKPAHGFGGRDFGKIHTFDVPGFPIIHTVKIAGINRAIGLDDILAGTPTVHAALLSRLPVGDPHLAEGLEFHL
jgi:hypothetical protein